MQTILIQLDTDSHASSFDRVVATDAGTDRLFSYSGINSDNVEGLIHGAIFTRGPADLKNTAIFVGGSDVAAGEAVMQRVLTTFFGPLRVSVLMDSNGCNTTAAAAVVAAAKHVTLSDSSALVLGGTGPVGQRVARILSAEGCQVRLASRSLERAAQVCETITAGGGRRTPEPVAVASVDDCLAAAGGINLLVAAGAAGVCFLPEGRLTDINGLQVAVDLNAVPPTGIADIQSQDKATTRSGMICYGALGVGGTKMKVHRQAVRELFQANDRVFDTDEIYQIARQVVAKV